jgi:hypothetical protein
MSRIVGIACDACGKTDIEINAPSALAEDSFPRNNWLSMNQWDDKGNCVGEEAHLCSFECMKTFVDMVLNHNHDDGHPHNHTHDHEQN